MYFVNCGDTKPHNRHLYTDADGFTEECAGIPSRTED